MTPNASMDSGAYVKMYAFMHVLTYARTRLTFMILLGLHSSIVIFGTGAAKKAS